MRAATRADLSTLIRLMTAFYAEAGYALDRALATAAFEALLTDQRLGYVWLIQAKLEVVGHLVVTLKFAMEYGGMVACIDDLYVDPASRNKGLGTAALLHVKEVAMKSGIRAVTVEVGFGNGPAQAAYRRVGFVETTGRQLLSLALAAPSHAV
jgi:GNAT superfamily N-acetyltransferase